MKIDQDILCDYCKEYHNSDMETCEGIQCEKITDIYLEAVGIIDDDKKTFRNVRLNDRIYILITDTDTPKIEQKIILSIVKRFDNIRMKIQFDTNRFIEISSDTRDSDNFENYFLYKKDCQKALEVFCTAQIVKLSKIIGSAA